MRKLKLFFACLLMAVLSIGQMWGADYALYTSSEITAGDYIIVGQKTSDSKYYAMNNTCTNNQYMGIEEVTVSNNKITTNATNIVWTVSSTTGGYYIKNGNNFLDDNATSNKNYAKLVGTAAATSVWSFAISSSKWSITNNGTTTTKDKLSFNMGSTRVACYASLQTGANQIYLYKKVTLSSIAVKTAPSKVSYTEGENFDPTGLVIRLTYSDNSTEDVTYNNSTKGNFTFSPTLTTSLQTSHASVTITYGGKTTSQAITVAASGCTNSITINKGSESHGTFTLDKEGSQATCSGLTVVVTPDAADHYHVGSVSATTGETGSDNGDGTWTITYAENSTGSSTINVVFAEDNKYTLNYHDGSGDDTKTSVYEGTNLITALGTPAASCDATSTAFQGWSTSEIATKTNTPPTFVAANDVVNSTTAAATYYAVYAKKGDLESVKGGNIASSFGETGLSGSHSEFYTGDGGNGFKFKAANNYVTTGDISSNNYKDVTVKLKAGHNGGSGSILTIASLDKDGNTIDSETLTPSEAYTSQSTTYTFELSGNKVIKEVRVTMTSKTNNLGMKYCEVFHSSLSDYMTTCSTPLGTISGTVTMHQNSADLSWDLASAQNGGKAHITSWKVEYKKDGDAGWTVAENTLAVGTLTKTITGLTCNSDYSFRVSANVENGYSAEAYEVSDQKTTQYTITLTGSGSVSGGTFTVKGESAASVSACDGDNIAIVATRSPGYDFSGWTIAKTAGTVSPAAATASTSFTMPAENVTVTAAFAAQHHDVVFHKNDGGEDETDTQDFTYGVAQNLKTISAIGWTRTNYNFGGWMTTSGGSSADKLDGVSYTLNVESDVDLFALWVADNTRTISYSGDTHIASYSSKPTTVDVENDDEFSVAFTLEDHYTLSSVAVSMGSTPLAANLISFDQSSLTVTAPDGGFTDNISVAFTIAATNYTVNWYVNGSKVHDQTDVFNTDYDEVPDDFSAFTDCSDFHFVGWKDGSAIDGFVTEAPIMAEIGTKITANKNYYAVFAEGTPGGTTKVFEETFAESTGTAGWSGNGVANGDLVFDNDGWASTYGAGNGGSAKFGGSSNKLGTATTPSISLTGNATLTFKSGAWISDTESTTLNLSATGATLSGSSVELTKGEWNPYSINITGASGSITITFTGGAASKGRFFLDDVVITQTASPSWTKWYTTCPHVARVTLTPATNGNGTISFAKDSKAITSIVTAGESAVTVDVVVASHDTGYGLSGVELSGVTGASYSNGVITIPANAEGTLTATATFAQANYTVTLAQYPANAGATLSENITNAHYGEEQTITTDEPTGYLFDGWWLFDASTFDASDIDWSADLSSEIFTGTYEGNDLVMNSSFLMPDKSLVAVAAYETLYTVAEAIAEYDANGQRDKTYVEGIVCTASTSAPSSGKMSYYISDIDENGAFTGSQFELYKGKGLNNANFSAASDVKVGDKVRAYGTLTKFGTTYELAEGNYLVSHTAAALESVVVTVPDASLVQTAYYSGDAFSFAGFKATAVYNTGYKKDVTSEVTWKANNADSYTVTAAGTVNVTATWNEKTSANYPVTVTVTTKTLEEITLSEYAFTGYKGIALPKPTTVTAHFDDLGVKSTENVTGSAVFDEGNVYSATSTSAQTIEVKYTFGPNTATKNYTVTLSSIENTEETAYSVTEARGIIDLDQVEGNDLDLANNLVYVEGIITAKTTNEITIKDVTDATKTIVLYKSTLGTGISSVDVNDRIKALGVLKLFNNTKYELDEGCEIVWKQPKVGITIANKALSIGNTWTIEATTDPAAAAAGLTYSIKDDGVSSTYVSLNTTTNEITALAEGSATIIAHAEAYDTYAENTVEFTVTVGASVNVVILAQYRGQWYAMKNAVEDSKIKAVAVDYRHGKLFDVAAADQAAITWTRTFSNEKYTFTNGENYLKGGTNTTLSLAEGASEAYQWNWNSTSGYYTTNTSATYRTFLYNGTEFKNFAVSNAKTGTGETEDYSALPVVVESEDIFVTTGYERNVTVGRMGTVCVDHNVPAGMIFGAEVYQLLFWKYGNSYADCQMVDFEEVTEMEAGKPYLIIPTDTKFTLVYGETTVAAPVSYNGFYGTFDPIAAATDNVLVGKYGIVNNMIQKLGENCYSPANRAYIDLSETYSQADYEALHGSSPAPEMKRVSLGREGAQTPTGMENVETSEQPQKLMINGQLFILHGEKMYDATGRLVK